MPNFIEGFRYIPENTFNFESFIKRWALFELRLTIIFSILSVVKLILRHLLSITYLGFVGRLLQLFNKVHWLEKKELKSLASSLKSVIKRFL